MQAIHISLHDYSTPNSHRLPRQVHIPVVAVDSARQCALHLIPTPQRAAFFPASTGAAPATHSGLSRGKAGCISECRATFGHVVTPLAVRASSFSDLPPLAYTCRTFCHCCQAAVWYALWYSMDLLHHRHPGVGVAYAARTITCLCRPSVQGVDSQIVLFVCK